MFAVFILLVIAMALSLVTPLLLRLFGMGVVSLLLLVMLRHFGII